MRVALSATFRRGRRYRAKLGKRVMLARGAKSGLEIDQ